MSNLTTWSKKYSTEAKFNITVVEAHQQRGDLFCLFWSLATAILFFAYLSLSEVNEFIIIGLPLIWALVLSIWFFNVKPFSGSFTLNDGGVLELENGDRAQLSSESFYSNFGCMLVGEQIETNASLRVFIYSDSVDKESYCRICRTINRIKLAQPKLS